MATITTLIIRITIYTDDSNLFVVAMTFLLSLVTFYCIIILVKRLLKNRQ